MNQLLNILALIFQGLPCPDCSYHSYKIFKENKNKIKKKDDLKSFLHYLHNEVNKKTKSQVEDISILEKYKECDMKNVIIKWASVFNPPKHIPKLMANNMHITIIKKRVLIYLRENLKHYL